MRSPTNLPGGSSPPFQESIPGRRRPVTGIHVRDISADVGRDLAGARGRLALLARAAVGWIESGGPRAPALEWEQQRDLEN
jgi:hypothetical protein